MSGGIYLIQDDGELVKMSEQAYDSEDLLQELLAKYSDLLAGDQVDATEPRQWLLVSREVSLASEEDGAGRWSVDHLLVPRIIGQTAKPPPILPGTKWNKELFFQGLEAQAPAAVKSAEAIFEWAESKAFRIVWGRGKQYGTFSPKLDHEETEHKPLTVWTDGFLSISFGDMRTKPPFDDEFKRSEFLRRLNEIPGIIIPDKAIDKYPSISLSTLNSEIAQFLKVLDWFVQEVKAT